MQYTNLSSNDSLSAATHHRLKSEFRNSDLKLSRDELSNPISTKSKGDEKDQRIGVREVGYLNIKRAPYSALVSGQSELKQSKYNSNQNEVNRYDSRGDIASQQYQNITDQFQNLTSVRPTHSFEKRTHNSNLLNQSRATRTYKADSDSHLVHQYNRTPFSNQLNTSSDGHKNIEITISPDLPRRFQIDSNISSNSRQPENLQSRSLVSNPTVYTKINGSPQRYSPLANFEKIPSSNRPKFQQISESVFQNENIDPRNLNLPYGYNNVMTPFTNLNESTIKRSQSLASGCLLDSQRGTHQEPPSQNKQQIEDRMIETYQKEIRSYATLEVDFEHLQKRFDALTYANSELQNSIQQQQGINQQALIAENTKIEAIKVSLDQARTQSYQENESASELRNQIADARRTVQNQNTSLHQMASEVNREIHIAQQTHQEIVSLKRKMADAQQVREAQQQKILDQEQSFQSCNNLNQKTQNHIREIEIDISNLLLQQQKLELLLKQKLEAFVETCHKIDKQKIEVQKIQAEGQHQEMSLEQAKQHNQIILDAKGQYQRQLEQEIAKNKEYQQRLKQIGMRMNHLSDEQDCTERELQCTKEANQRLMQQGENQQQELNALRQYVDLLKVQNLDIQKELEEFVRAEEVLMSGLDRKARVDQVRMRNEKEVAHSANILQQTRSPVRQYQVGMPLPHHPSRYSMVQEGQQRQAYHSSEMGDGRRAQNPLRPAQQQM